MKHQTETYELNLDAAAVDDFSDKIRHFLAKVKCDSKDIIRYAMTVEEIMLNSMADDKEKKVTLTTGSKFRRPFISLSVSGEEQNAFKSDDENSTVLGNEILEKLGLSPMYSYEKNENKYLFRVKKKSLNPFISLMITVGIAVAVGLLGLLMPENIRNIVLENILNPLQQIFLNLVGCIAGPMVFLSVAWGIYGIGDAATLKHIGSKIMKSYLSIPVFFGLFGLVSLPFFKLKIAGAFGDVSGSSELIGMITGIVPKNIVSPFSDGNTIQIIFIAFAVGIALLVTGQKSSRLAKAIEQLNNIAQFFIEIIGKLIIYYVFILVVTMMWSDTSKAVVRMGKFFAVAVPMYVGTTLLYVIYTSLRNRVSIITMLKRTMPIFILGITTASSSTAFGRMDDLCKRQLGIDESLSSFGLPLGMVMCKPFIVFTYMLMTLFFAEHYGVKITPVWMIMLILSSVILSVATPPVPGGAIASYTVIFAQLGIPSEALVLALACDVFLDFLCTASDITTVPLILLNCAQKLKKVDNNILKSKR